MLILVRGVTSTRGVPGPMNWNYAKHFAAHLSLKNLKKVIILFDIFLLCFIWGSLLHKIESERELEINSAVRETANLARAFEEHTLRTIKSADQTAAFLKYQYGREGRNVDLPRYEREGRFANQPFLLMGIIGEDGQLIASDQVPFVPSNLKDREHFYIHKASREDRLFISKPVLGRSSGRWSIQMTRRIDKADGSFGGVVVVSVDPFYFADFYKQMDLGRNFSITLVGLDGIVRARQAGQNSDLGQDISDSVVMKHLNSSASGYYIANSKVDGIKRIYSYRAFSEYPLAVLVGIDEQEALAGMNQRAVSYYWICIIATVIIILFGVLLIKFIKQQRRDREALHQAYEELEDKVLLRTKELFSMNGELAAANEGLQKANRQLAKKTEEIQEIAYSDALTGLPNRLYFNEWIDQEMRKASRGEAAGCVLFIDLDDFKMINDVLGHSYGDASIVIAGQRIVATAGRDALVARIGGDEFVVILSGLSDRAAIAGIAEAIVRELGIDYDVGGECFSMSASIGIACYPQDGHTAEDILKNADNAMYAAKKNDRNSWSFYEAYMQKEALEKMVLRNSLRYAIERKELSLKYQPQVTAGDCAIVGFEALLRWDSAEHGPVSPATFIPIAEQSGLIYDIGAWVLREACGFARYLAMNGHADLVIAINVSAKQLADDDFIDLVRTTLAETGINPSQIELEITESLLMNSLEDARCKLDELRAIGVRLALDDFGTGFSSLTYLWNLPVSTLKLDKSFIDIILYDAAKAKIVSTIIHMAHDFNMLVVAEGVEQDEQLCYLRENSCDLIQGYYISKPVSKAEAVRLVLKAE